MSRSPGRWANQGAVPTNVDRWVDAVYLATAPTLDTPGVVATLVFAAPNFGTFSPGQSYTQTATFTLAAFGRGQLFIVKTNVSPSLLLFGVDQSLMAHGRCDHRPRRPGAGHHGDKP